ncbi:MAG: hypothetical protein DRR11_06650 [Gammaproteobacteria bacterium]|nr:MAG: hypothetical protein DRR11_06650 [Gammaproteobacteria bacterium]
MSGLAYESRDGLGRAKQDARADESRDGLGRAKQDARADESRDGLGRAKQEPEPTSPGMDSVERSRSQSRRVQGWTR